MENKNCAISKSRRSALKKIAAGVGVLAGYAVLPEQWTSPIIGQIVLPAHAATSGATLHDPCTVTVTAGDGGSNSVTLLVTGFVTPPTNNVPIHIVATATGGSGASVSADTTTDVNGNFSASLTVGGGPGITAISVTTTATGATGTAKCSVNVGAGLPALTQCAIVFNPGVNDQLSPSINFQITGSVNPPTVNVPIHIIWATAGAGAARSPIDLVTNGAGVYAIGLLPNDGPGFTQVTATITSSGATGTTSCLLNVPAPD